MEIIADPLDKQSLNVLLVGNNPSLMSPVFEALMPMNGVRYNIDFVFDFLDLKKSLRRFKPHCIIIHDDIRPEDVKYLFKLIKHNREIPVTLIKQTNDHGNMAADITEFILESELSPSTISKTLIRSLNSRNKHFIFSQSVANSRKISATYQY